jgi:hypothetical protein
VTPSCPVPDNGTAAGNDGIVATFNPPEPDNVTPPGKPTAADVVSVPVPANVTVPTAPGVTGANANDPDPLRSTVAAKFVTSGTVGGVMSAVLTVRTRWKRTPHATVTGAPVNRVTDYSPM